MHPRRVAFLFLSLVVGFGPGVAGARTLTAADGRAMEAEVTGFDGDKVVVKRADTGQVFTLPISAFAEADQRALRAEAAEAAKKPRTLPTGAIALELSRVRFDSRKEKKDVTLVGGGVAKDALQIIEEEWGYTFTLRNTTGQEIEGLRADYILFAKVDVLEGRQGGDKLRRVRKQAAVDPVPVNGRVVVRSEAIRTRKTELKGNVVWKDTADRDTRDTLHGIWLRVYQGDALVLESASPSSLMTTEKWETGR